MFSFWLVVLISVFFCIGFIVFSVQSDQAFLQLNKQANSSNSVNPINWLFAMPLLLIILAPLYYQFSGSYQKQRHQRQVSEQIQALYQKHQDGQDKQLFDTQQISLQDLMLGLRVKTHEDKSNAKIWLVLSQGYANLGMNDIAISSAQRAIRLQPQADWMVYLARLLAVTQSQSNLQQAVDILRQVVSRHPEHQGALISLGFIYLNLQDYPQAIAAWKTLLDSGKISESAKKQLIEQINRTEKMIENQ